MPNLLFGFNGVSQIKKPQAFLPAAFTLSLLSKNQRTTGAPRLK
jgi:hypothetical protein